VDEKIVADLCVKSIELLHRIYLKGEITKETYMEHTKVKLDFLQMYGFISEYDKLKDMIDNDLDSSCGIFV
jgi:hypothetical protein